MSDLPLYALASQAYVAFQIEYEQLTGRGLHVTAALEVAFPTPRVPLADVAARLGIDGSGKGSLERHGILRVEDDGGVRMAVLTEQGCDQVDGHQARLRAIDEDWRARYGTATVDQLHAALEAVNAKLPPGLPDYCVVRWWHDISRLAAA